MSQIEYYKLKTVPENSILEQRFFKVYQKGYSREASLEQVRAPLRNVDIIHLYFLKKNNEDIGAGYMLFTKDAQNPNIHYARGLGFIVPEERGEQLPNQLLVSHFIKYKLLNPFKKVYFVAVAMNPITYLGFFKYWKSFYPHPHKTTPPKIQAIKELGTKQLNMNEIEEGVVQYPFNIIIEEKDKARFEEMRDNPYVNYFFEKRNDSAWSTGMLIVAPLNFANLSTFVLTYLSKLFIRPIQKKLGISPSSIQPQAQ